MHYSTQRHNVNQFPGFIPSHREAANNNEISCNWHVLREQLVNQWDRLSVSELENTGHNRIKIAGLIQNKYGISVEMAVNYLRNFERTLPLLGCA